MTSSEPHETAVAETTATEKKTPRTTGVATATVRAEIDAGICGFNTTVRAEAESMRKVKLDIESDCPQIRKAAEQLPEMDMLEELKAGLGHGHVYEVLSGCVRHVTCPVGSGILKAAESAAGLALPKDVSIKLTKE
ncbi:MAG: hypothetical protein KKA32_11090 [Actinobacteria bacterium]|nr:hypothetical protein [Actinomycetota bacterium]